MHLSTQQGLLLLLLLLLLLHDVLLTDVCPCPASRGCSVLRPPYRVDEMPGLQGDSVVVGTPPLLGSPIKKSKLSLKFFQKKDTKRTLDFSEPPGPQGPSATGPQGPRAIGSQGPSATGTQGPSARCLLAFLYLYKLLESHFTKILSTYLSICNGC